MFFTYYQNNSGGSFDHEPGKYGFAVVIEAETAAQANSKAEDLGLYFDGENDCPCCGRRWWGLPIYVHYLDGRSETHEHIRDVQRRAE